MEKKEPKREKVDQGKLSSSQGDASIHQEVYEDMKDQRPEGTADEENNEVRKPR